MGRFFIWIYNLVKKHYLVAIVLLLSIVLLNIFLASKLKFSEDITKILPENDAINNMNFVYTNSKFLDKVVFSLHIGDTSITNPELLSKFADQITDSLQSKYVPHLIKSIEKAPSRDVLMEVYEEVYANLPTFLNSNDYKHIDSILTDSAIRQTIISNYATLLSPASFVTKRFISRDPLHLTPIALEKLKTLNIDNDFQIFNNYFISGDRKNIVFLITPQSTNKTSNNNLLFDGINETISDLSIGEYSQIKVDYFGNAVVALGNANQIKDDIIITVSLALLLLIIAISIFFKSKRSFLVIFLPVIFGALVSLGGLYIIKGEISAISLGIGAVLLGICVDFALHIYSHFRANSNYKLVLKDLATPVMLSSFTTASAFISLYFINSEALNDLGLFAAISIISAAIFSLIVLPHLIRKTSSTLNNKKTWLDKIAGYDFSKNKYLKISIIILTIVLYFSSKNVGFDADMMKNNYMSDDLKDVENRINNVTDISKKTIYLVSPGATVAEAIDNNNSTSKTINRLIEEGVIQNAAIPNKIVPSLKNQKESIERWNNYWHTNYDRVISAINKTADSLGFSKNAFKDFEKWITSSKTPLIPSQLSTINSMFLENYIIETDTLAAVLNIIKVNNNEKDINRVYDEFNHDSNTWVIDKRLITSEFVTILNNNFNKLVVVSLSFVFIILLIAYGRIELTIITMIPIVFSWIWTVGIMGLLNIDFNIFNVIILTFIFGLGIDYSIFVMRGLLLEFKYGKRDQSSYHLSVILSGITTLLGIGVLVFAAHPALRSIAIMSIIGIFSVIFITLTLLPSVFNWLVSYKKGLRNRPIIMVDFLFSMWALFVFISGSIILSILSLLMPIVPIRKKYKKIFIHKLFRYLTWFMIYMNFASKKAIINPLNEDYRKPSIIIANHQSHIDLMLMMLLNYRVVVLTNKFNFNNPVYGPALRYAGFIEVDGNYDKIVEQVEKQTSEGYSVVVFPEGHRSEGKKLRRFHKGAFVLAEKLNLDILPIIIYGQKEALKKSEFFLKRATAVTKFLPRINLKEGKYGLTSRDQAKNIKAYFEEEYFKVAHALETPNYFNDFISKNYLYKGPVLEWYTKIKLKIENNYNFFNDIIPNSCTITDLGCGYGYLALLLNMVSDKRSITGIDYDEDKIAVASNCAIKADNVNFVIGDISEMELPNSDIFILNDVLHYLPLEMQKNVIVNCLNKLNKGGKVIIRDADKDMEDKHKFTKLTELFSTKLLGFNKTNHNLEFISSSVIKDIASNHNAKLDIIDNTKHTSNIIFVLTL